MSAKKQKYFFEGEFYSEKDSKNKILVEFIDYTNSRIYTASYFGGDSRKTIIRHVYGIKTFALMDMTFSNKMLNFNKIEALTNILCDFHLDMHHKMVIINALIDAKIESKVSELEEEFNKRIYSLEYQIDQLKNK